jgi:hypothetical protein
MQLLVSVGPFWIGVHSQAKEAAVSPDVEVFREAGDFECAEDNGLRRVGEVHSEERIRLTEGHDIADGAVETDGVDLFAGGKVSNTADGLQVSVQYRQGV